MKELKFNDHVDYDGNQIYRVLKVDNYKLSDDDVMSWYVYSDDEYTPEEALEALELNGISDTDVEFVEWDDAVASYKNVKNCAVFHEFE